MIIAIAIPLITGMAERLERALDQAKREALDDAREISPTPGPDHPYATGRYARSWRWEGSRLVNDAPYAEHTDRGDTRYHGSGSALPWIARGRVPYSEQIIKTFSLAFRLALTAERAIRGR